MAGQPSADAIWWASAVLPEPGGPLTTTSVGREKAVTPMTLALSALQVQIWHASHLRYADGARDGRAAAGSALPSRRFTRST